MPVRAAKIPPSSLPLNCASLRGMKYITAMLMVLVLGCSLSGTGPTAASPEECTHYDDSYMGWSATATVFGGLAGVGGIVIPIVQENMDDPKDAIMGIGIGTAIAGALAAGAGVIGDMYAQRYSERGCGAVIEFPNIPTVDDIVLPIAPDPSEPVPEPDPDETVDP